MISVKEPSEKTSNRLSQIFLTNIGMIWKNCISNCANAMKFDSQHIQLKKDVNVNVFVSKGGWKRRTEKKSVWV